MMNEFNEYIKKVNYYLLKEYLIDVRGETSMNNVVFNWYFESYSKNETFQSCAGRIGKYIRRM